MEESIRVAGRHRLQYFSSTLVFLLLVTGVAGRSALVAGLPSLLVHTQRVEAPVRNEKENAISVKLKQSKKRVFPNLCEKVRKDCSDDTTLPRSAFEAPSTHNMCSTRSNKSRRTGMPLNTSLPATAKLECAVKAEYRRPHAREQWISNENCAPSESV